MANEERRWDENQSKRQAMGLQVVLEDNANPSTVQRGRHLLPRPAPTLESLSRAAMPSVFNDARLHLSDFLSYTAAFSIKEDSSKLFQGPIGWPCNVLFCPHASSSVKFVSEEDGFKTAHGKLINLGAGPTGTTLVGFDGQFALLLVQGSSPTCFRVYNLVTDDLKTIGAPPLAPSSSTETVDLRIGFLVHQDMYFIVCICLLKGESEAYFYDSTKSANGWVNVQFAVPTHLSDYVATRTKFELFWVNLDRESEQINVLVFDTLTELFTVVEVQNPDVTHCKTASVLSLQKNEPAESTPLDVLLCMVMTNGAMHFHEYEEQEDGSNLFVLRFRIQGPDPSPERVLFSIGSGGLICTNGASVWRLDILSRTVKRVSVVPQFLGEEAPIYHTLFSGSLEPILEKLNTRLASPGGD